MSTTATEQDIRLAIDGGEPSMTLQPEPRKRWGDAELQQLTEMIEQDSLFYWNGPQTKLFTERFKEYYPFEYVMPCSSGTAAIHIAVAAAGVGPGDEVITAPITDMGTVIGILYQQGVPVFADLEPNRYNLDVEDVRKKITPRTKAIIAVHLTGNPCDLGALRQLSDEHGIVLIEDCAQAWGSMYRSQAIGTIGHIGCFSINDFKHIGCGDGGIVGSSDERFGPLLQKFGDKAYTRGGGGRAPDVLAPNYRITEPQSAVAAAQMTRMWDYTGQRAAAGRLMNELIADVPGIHPHHADPEDRWTCWFYMFRIDASAMSCDSRQFAAALNAEGVGCGAGYTQMPLYKYPVFQEHNFFAGRWPIKELGLTDMDYTKVCCPETEAIIDTCISIGMTEVTTEEWVREAAAALRKVAAHYYKG